MTQTRHATVGELNGGEVISLPESGLRPAVITRISKPLGGMRLIDVQDIETGLPNESRFSLGVERAVVVHETVVEEHSYLNTSPEPIEVTLGHRVTTVRPGEVVRYFGEAKPEVFDERFRHSSTSIVTRREDWPL